MSEWDWPCERLDRATCRFHVAAGGQSLAWAEVLDLWRGQPRFADAFSDVLAAMPWSIFRWETPPLTTDGLNTAFECVVVDSPELSAAPDPTPFAEHLRQAGESPVVRFANLGGDAWLVVPRPLADATVYAHLASFVRGAPRTQQRALWREVARAMQQRLGEQPVWLSTAGGGVAWLHLRLDSRPKYYMHAPYRSATERAGR